MDFIREFSQKHGMPHVEYIMDLLLGAPQVLYQVALDSSPADDGEFQRLCDIFDTLSHSEHMALAAGIGDRLRSDITGLRWERVAKNVPAVLIDMPIEPGASKLGDDIIVVRDDDDEEYAQSANLMTASGIINGINNSFRSHLRRLRVFIHPELVDSDRRKDRNYMREIRMAIREHLILNMPR